MKIGELQRRTGLSVRMLRYQKAEGLLAPVRTAKEYRYYGLADEQAVIRIRLLEVGGMTLAAIHKFLPCVRGDSPVLEPCDELRRTLHQQIALADQKMERPAQSRAVLATLIPEIEDQDP